MKKIFFALVVLLVVVVVAYAVLKRPGQKIDQEAVLQCRDLYAEFKETGWVNPRNRLEIIPAVSGRIEEILVKEGEAVKKGQIIIWISSSERAAMIDAARTMGESEHKRWQSIYKPTPVVAPMNGFIISRRKEPGQTVKDSDVMLVMADDLIIEAYINEADLKHIKIGQELKISLDAYPEDEFKGIVEHIAYDANIENNVTTYGVHIRPVKKPKEFRSGMTAAITVVTETKKGALSIPDYFISEKGNKKIVTVKNGTLKRPVFETREVVTGITDGIFTEIVSGLSINETVITFKSDPKKSKKKDIDAD